MYVILGASGHTGHVIAKNLLSLGKKVRVVGRNAAHLQPLGSHGAEAFIGDTTDAIAMTRAFHQADSAFVMIPPNYAAKDPGGFQDRVSDAVVTGLQNAGVKNVVLLSSVGADKASGTGPVTGLHRFEAKLKKLSAANVLNLRAGYFMENTLAQAGAIRQVGSVVTPLRPDLKLPMIATHDVGTAAADALAQLSFRGNQIRELLGQRDINYTDVTTSIGKAIGRPDLKYVQCSNDQFRAMLVQLGMTENLARSLAEMTDAMNSGELRALESRSSTNTTPTTYETFVAEAFLPVYKQQAAA